MDANTLTECRDDIAASQLRQQDSGMCDLDALSTPASLGTL